MNTSSNIQITATAVEFKNGNNGYRVDVNGMEGKIKVQMHFKEPLKAMRYMFVLSKRLKLQINSIDLAAVQLDYQRSKELATQAQQMEQDAVQEVQSAIEEESAEATEEPSPLGVEAKEESPMIKQFQEMKSKHPEALLLFRCGDFYETYHDDAADAAKILGITLTVRTSDKTRMAGFPHHALDTYLPKLIRAGKRVAICDQLEVGKKTKTKLVAK